MAKKIALLISLVMMFSLSCVFAADLETTPSTADTSISADVSDEVLEDVSDDTAAVVSGENVTSGEVNTEVKDEVESNEVIFNKHGA